MHLCSHFQDLRRNFILVILGITTKTMCRGEMNKSPLPKVLFGTDLTQVHLRDT